MTFAVCIHGYDHTVYQQLSKLVDDCNSYSKPKKAHFKHSASRCICSGTLIQQGLKVWDASRPSPSLTPLPFPLFPFLSPSFPFPLPFPLEVGTPQLRLRGLGERSSSPGGSGWSPAAMRILTHFRPKFAPF